MTISPTAFTTVQLSMNSDSSSVNSVPSSVASSNYTTSLASSATIPTETPAETPATMPAGTPVVPSQMPSSATSPVPEAVPSTAGAMRNGDGVVMRFVQAFGDNNGKVNLKTVGTMMGVAFWMVAVWGM